MTAVAATESVRMAPRMAVVLSAALFVAGCATTGESGVKPLSFAQASQASRPAGSETLLAALNGGLLPNGAVAGLSKTDRLRALEAEYKALESAPGGSSVSWKSFDGGASGEVIAATPYQVGQQNCRQYTHKAVIGGQAVTGQGAACRNPNGSWTPLT